MRIQLHPSFKPNDIVELFSPPFHLSRRGYGEFPIKITVHFKNYDLNKPLEVVHTLALDQECTGKTVLSPETVVDLELNETVLAASKSVHKTDTKIQQQQPVVPPTVAKPTTTVKTEAEQQIAKAATVAPTAVKPPIVPVKQEIKAEQAVPSKSDVVAKPSNKPAPIDTKAATAPEKVKQEDIKEEKKDTQGKRPRPKSSEKLEPAAKKQKTKKSSDASPVPATTTTTSTTTTTTPTTNTNNAAASPANAKKKKDNTTPTPSFPPKTDNPMMSM